MNRNNRFKNMRVYIESEIEHQMRTLLAFKYYKTIKNVKWIQIANFLNK